jgi:hypothetical protein
MLRTGTCQLFSGFKQAFDSAVSLTFRFRRSLFYHWVASSLRTRLTLGPTWRLSLSLGSLAGVGIAAKIAGNPEPLVLELNQSVAFARVEDYL